MIVINQEKKGFRLLTEQWLPAPRRSVFPYFADAGNLEALTPEFLHFSILTPGSIEMAVGVLIDYRLSLHGFPVRWRTRIALWQPDECFVDEQVRGPYRRWVHTHSFEDHGEHTLMRDAVEYSVPGGSLAHRLLVARDLKRIFLYRRQVLEGRFGQIECGIVDDHAKVYETGA